MEPAFQWMSFKRNQRPFQGCNAVDCCHYYDDSKSSPFPGWRQVCLALTKHRIPNWVFLEDTPSASLSVLFIIAFPPVKSVALRWDHGEEGGRLIQEVASQRFFRSIFRFFTFCWAASWHIFIYQWFIEHMLWPMQRAKHFTPTLVLLTQLYPWARYKD